MTYEIINAATRNTIAAYETTEEALEGCRALMGDTYPVTDLVVVAFDEDGEAVEALPVEAAVVELA